MKIIYISVLLNTFLFALFLDNPHEIDIVGKDLNSTECKNCHLSFNGNYSGYFASIYRPTIDEYYTYLASLENFSIDDLQTAGSDLQTSDTSYTNPWSISSSKLCMSCHDDVIAIGVSHQETLKISLKASHPISVEYIEAKQGLKNKNSKIYNWNNASVVKDILVNDKIECVSCHSPHSKSYTHYLRSENTGSKLCLGCHNK